MLQQGLRVCHRKCVSGWTRARFEQEKHTSCKGLRCGLQSYGHRWCGRGQAERTVIRSEAAAKGAMEGLCVRRVGRWRSHGILVCDTVRATVLAVLASAPRPTFNRHGVRLA